LGDTVRFILYLGNPSATLVPLKSGHLSSPRLFTFNQTWCLSKSSILL